MRFTLTLLLTVILAAGAGVRADDLPADWTAASVETFDREPFAVAQPPQDLLRRDFTRFSLTRFPGARVAGASAQWRLQPDDGVHEAALSLPLSAGVDGYAIWIKNPLSHAVGLAVRVTDASGRTWRTQPRLLLENKNWTRYVFGLDRLGDSQQFPQIPYRSAALVLSDLQPGQDYTLYLDELEALQAPPPQLRGVELTAPAQVRSGDSIPVGLVFESTRPAATPVQLTLSLQLNEAPAMLRCAALAPGQSRLRVMLTIPRHIASGAYQLCVQAEGAQLSGLLSREVRVTGTPPPSRVEVLPPALGGCFAVDGAALPLIGGWWQKDAGPERFPWVMVPVTSDFDFTGRCAQVWLGPDEFDYSAVDRKIAAALGANPEARVIPIIHVSSPPWWDQQHPKELMVFGDGKSRLPVGVSGAKQTVASWASEVWRKDAATALSRLITHLEGGPWAPAIIGYQLASGEDGRWIYPGATEGVLGDYSAPQQDAFRAWLKNKYQDISLLRVAWGQPRDPVNSAEALKEFRPIMGWHQASVPNPARRTRAPSGVLHDPNAAQDLVDYQVFCSDLVAETIEHLAQAASQASGGKKLIGVSYGHLFDLAATRTGLQDGGHLALAPVCASQHLSFIASPATMPGAENLPVPGTAAQSLARHGKLWLAQADAQQAGTAIVNALTAGGVAAVEAMPQSAPWLPRLSSLPAAMPRHSISEVAVVVDDISAAYTARGNDLVKPLLSDQRLGLALMGAPYDVWTLDDVLSGSATGYKLYIFLDTFYLDANARKQLAVALGQQKCTALWIYAPGVLDLAINSRTAKELTGLTLVRPLQAVPGPKVADGSDGPVIRTDRGPLQVRMGGAGGYVYGTPAAITPRFAAMSDQADIYGSLVGSEFGGYAVTRHGDFKSVWSAAPHLPASLLRSIAAEADVHVFADNGTGVYANQNLLAVRASADGNQRIQLPRMAEVTDLADGRPVGPAATSFTVNMHAGEMRLYYWGSAPLTAR